MRSYKTFHTEKAGSAAVAAAFRAGVVLEGKYRITSTIGKGSMGMVFEATDQSLTRTVAVKVVDPKAAPVLLDFFRREASSMAKIRHPNVAQIYSFGDHQGFPFFVMEYIAGEHLRAFIDRQGRQGLPVDVSIGILRQVCDGLTAVHDQGLVHYDVKPENILVGAEYRVCLVDFGVAQSLHSGIPELAGTPPYISPEVIDGRPLPEQMRPRSDIFSLGVCTYELLTGSHPFDRPQITDVGEMLQQLAKQPAKPLSALRDDLSSFEEVIARAMAKDPADRFASCAQFVSALQTARGQQEGGTSRILVVDDDPDIRLMFGSVLEAVVESSEVHTAEDGLVAYELAKALQPDLILIDLNMPRVNGVELCSLLRGVETLQTVPMVVISAQADRSTRQLLERLGVLEVLAKPLSPKALAALARRLLE